MKEPMEGVAAAVVVAVGGGGFGRVFWIGPAVPPVPSLRGQQ